MSDLDSPEWKDFSRHHYNCVQCRKATLGRFSGVNMHVMFTHRCEAGKRLAKIFDNTLPADQKANWEYDLNA